MTVEDLLAQAPVATVRLAVDVIKLAVVSEFAAAVVVELLLGVEKLVAVDQSPTVKSEVVGQNVDEVVAVVEVAHHQVVAVVAAVATSVPVASFLFSYQY